METILITGGAGYIGSHAAQILLCAGYNVVIFDNLSTGFREAIDPRVDFVKGDIRNTELLSNVIRSSKASAIIHFAAKLNVKESTVDPISYYENNTYGMISVVKAALENKVDKIVFSSTAALFGNETQDRPIKEIDPKSPLNPYGFSKMMSEQILRDSANAYGLRYVILRYFNVAGAAVNGANGQRTSDAFHLVHIGSQVASGKRKEMLLFGTDYPTHDGTCVRDYIHVDDLGNIHLLGLKYLFDGGESQDFNCGYGFGYSVDEVIKTIAKVSDKTLKVVTSERRVGDAASLVADPAKLKRILGWQPHYADLEFICKTAYNWEKNLP